ncbi:MAG: hypothetical protein ACRD15_04040 [Vicinamibacterales bacterium]
MRTLHADGTPKIIAYPKALYHSDGTTTRLVNDAAEHAAAGPDWGETHVPTSPDLAPVGPIMVDFGFAVVQEPFSRKWGIEVAALGPDGTPGPAAKLHNAAFDTEIGAVDQLTAALRGTLQTSVPGEALFPPQAQRTREEIMEFSLRYRIERDATSQRFGVKLVAVDPRGVAIGQPASIQAPVFGSATEAAEYVVTALRGMFRTPVAGFFPSDFIFPRQQNGPR